MSLADQLWCPTSVQVTVLQARGLRTKGKGGTNDAYAVMQVGKDRYQTSVVEKSVAPAWREEAAFDLPHQAGGGGGCTLHVHVLHRALVGPDKQLGQAVIDLLQLAEDRSRSKSQWFKLLNKTGKADKDRGEVLLDIQYMRNCMTASMFDLSAAGKSKSRLGKLKDKVRGKKKENDATPSVAPSFPQVLTDSEDEAHEDGAAGKEEKKKGRQKMKSLFSSKSNLQRNMSQSMSVLPAKNSTLSSSQSSGLNVDSSAGKKKFKFMLHKRSDSKDKLSSGPQKPGSADQSNVCINGSHVYREEPQIRTSRIGSNFSQASSGHGTMEDVPESSPVSVDSSMAGRHFSPWKEEEEEMAEVEKETEDLEELTGEEEERNRMEDDRRRKEERFRKQKEMIERVAEKIRQEEERRQEEEERKKIEEEKIRQDEEERRRQEEEERKRIEDEQIRLEEERKLQEEEERKGIEKRRQEEEREIHEEEERKRIEQEQIRQDEEERRRQEEEERKRIEDEKIRQDEERRRQEENERKKIEQEQIRQEEERTKIEEEKIRLDEEKKIQEEEERKGIEDEKIRQEEERKRQEEEERKKTEEEKIRLEEERKIQEEEERKEIEKRRQEEEERLRRQEHEKLAEEKRKLEEQERRERIQEEEKWQREEEERVRVEEERVQEDKRRREEEERVRKEKEENERLEEERREKERIEAEEKRKRDEERIRVEEDKKRKEQQAERIRREEKELELKMRREEEEKRQREKEELIRKEEERKREEEDRARKEKDEYEKLVHEKKRVEELERRRKEEEERIRKEERERIRMEEEEERKRRQEEEERAKKQEGERWQEERKRLEQEKRRMEEEEQIRKEEEERSAQKEEEARKLKKLTKDTEAQQVENKTAPCDKPEVQFPAGVASTNPFGDDFSNHPFEGRPNSAPSAGAHGRTGGGCRAAVASVGSGTVSAADERDLISAQREKRPAPQPPGRTIAESQRREQGDKDLKAAGVLPRRPPGQSCPDSKNSQSPIQSSAHGAAASVSKNNQRPAPSTPPSAEEESTRGSPLNANRAVICGRNPFDEDELAAREDATAPSARWPPPVTAPADEDAASRGKLKSLKMTHAPSPPAKKAGAPSASIHRAAGAGRPADASGGEPQPARAQSAVEVAAGKREVPPTTPRRLQPVKPLNPLEQQLASIVPEGKHNKSTGILSGVQEKSKVNGTGLNARYSQLTKEELISLVLKQQKQLSERDRKTSELEEYIDKLLVRIIEEKPSILMSMNSLKKEV